MQDKAYKRCAIVNPEDQKTGMSHLLFSHTCDIVLQSYFDNFAWHFTYKIQYRRIMAARQNTDYSFRVTTGQLSNFM